MTLSDFAAFYAAVHSGWRPFRWQTELLERVVSSGWPDTIDLPTSSGKTSIIDIAIFLLALEAGKLLQDRRAAIRTFFVVDRRVVVDEAYQHACGIAEQLLHPADSITAEVARALRSYGGLLPLQVSRMRGGMLRDGGWADEPNQPLVCISTVDQVGSRLLFRGYQVNDRTWSVHAGLIGIDSLIVLDEAHLSNAFAETVQALKHRYTVESEKFPGLVTMSATPKQGAEAFSMFPEWIEHDKEVLQPRLAASKRTELREPKKRFEDEMVAAAKELAAGVKTGVVGVIANTIGAAREIFEKLNGESVLLVGRNRPWCAEELWNRYRTRIEAKPDRKSEGLLYVVATQTVEVGANISFDALVTESAPIDALRQRFGRLNRLGSPVVSKAIIVLRSKGDPVYGAPGEKTWALLKKREPVDFGVLAMNELLGGQDLEPMVSRRSRAPLLFPAHIELWAQTNPAPEPDPEIAPFLHGPEALEAADVQIVWREDLSEGDEANWPELIELAPPLAREALPMPVRAVRAWLRGISAPATADLEGIHLEETEEKKSRQVRPFVLWGSREASLITNGNIRPSQTIVVPVTYKGADEYGWNPDAAPQDIFDAVNADEARRGLRKRIVRLDVAMKGRDDVASLLAAWREDPDPELLSQILEALALEPTGARIDASGRIVTWPKAPIVSETERIEPVTAEYDETDDNSFTRRRTLGQHTSGVVEHARRYAVGCGLAEKLVDDIVLAARLHDWGKCDERFQAWLSGKPFSGGEYLAKSEEDRTQAERARLRKLAGYPANARHEAASVIAACASGLLAEAHDRDLVLHLIGTHHGYGRPWFPVWKEDPDFRVLVEAEGQSFECSSGFELARVDSGWVDRFAALNRRYGHWGLAYLEAILRRADCMQSREEAENAVN